MRMNQPVSHRIHTHEGGGAVLISPSQELRRSVLSCLLWEREFYESGKRIMDRIVELAGMVPRDDLANLAIQARNEYNVRHVSLLLALEYADRYTQDKRTPDVIDAVIQRADELAEFVAAWWARKPVKYRTRRETKHWSLPKNVKRGLARAFTKFDPYQLAKYDQKGTPVKLVDVMRLVHPKPATEGQSAVWRKLRDGKLESPDTWETALIAQCEQTVRDSLGLSAEAWRALPKDHRAHHREAHYDMIQATKRQEYERLLTERRLGYMALLRNLRNMLQAGVDTDLVRREIRARRGARRVLPFRFVAAARAAPVFEPDLDLALVAEIDAAPKLPGRTIVLVDVSASMGDPLSAKSDLTRMDAAAALAAVVPAESLRVWSFSSGNIRYVFDRWDGTPVSVEIPPRRGMAGVDAVINSQEHAGTLLGQAVKEMNELEYDRLIVITDEQSDDPVPAPKGLGYMINVASNQNGVGYGPWIHVNGFSERVIRWIIELENEKVA